MSLWVPRSHCQTLRVWLDLISADINMLALNHFCVYKHFNYKLLTHGQSRCGIQTPFEVDVCHHLPYYWSHREDHHGKHHHKVHHHRHHHAFQIASQTLFLQEHLQQHLHLHLHHAFQIYIIKFIFFRCTHFQLKYKIKIPKINPSTSVSDPMPNKPFNFGDFDFVLKVKMG